MKQNDAKKVIALMLVLAMLLATLCAAAEDSGVELAIGEAAQSNDGELTIEGGMDGEGIEGDIPPEEGLLIDALSQDGPESNLLTDALGEDATEDPADAPVGNDSKPEDFEIDENGVLVKYLGDGGDVIIPDGVTSIGDWAFESCSSLTSVTIPNSVTDIGGYAFSDCESLTSVTIGCSVESIGERAFSGRSKLTSINVDSKNNHFSSIDGVLFNKEQTIIITCPVGIQGEYVIPDSVTSIRIIAFEGCSNLTSVTIPDSVTEIGSWAFVDCKNLTSVTIGNSVTCIRDYAFSYCSSLTSVTIPDSVTMIMDWAFIGCSSLTKVLIPDSVTDIGWKSFGDCDDLTIYGNKGSAAEAYAKENDIPFLPSDEFGHGDEGDPVEMSECTVTVRDQVYTGKKLKPEVTVKYGKKALKKGTDYTVTYRNNKAIGTAAAIVKGKGEYVGTLKAPFTISPKSVAGLKLTAGKKKIKVKWKKAAGGVTGYQLEYGTKKNLKDAKQVTVKKAATVKRTLSGLKSRKTYYVRIRAYKKVGKATICSAWSSAKKAKVK